MKKRCTKALAVLLAATIAFGTVDMSVFAQQTSTQTVTEETGTAEQGEEVASSATETQAAEATPETMQSASDVVTESAAVEESVATEESVEEQEAFTLQESQTMEESAETQESTVAAESVVMQTNVVETVTEETSGISWDGVTTQQTYEGENYKITFLLDGYWNGGYNAKVKIQNTGNIAIENWYVAFDFANTVSNPWNAEVSSSENGSYVMKHASYNQDIAAGMTVEFGFGARENFKGFPTECVLLGEETETNEEDYTVNYRLDRDWGDGFTGTITVTNNSEQAIEDWRLEFDFERNITGIWNGAIESHEGSHYVIKNAGYNADIAPGQTVSFGFSGNGGSKANEPLEYVLYSYSNMTNVNVDIGVNTQDFVYNEDVQIYHISEEIDSLNGTLTDSNAVRTFCYEVKDLNGTVVKSGAVAVGEQWTIEDFGLSIGYNDVLLTATLKNGKTVEKQLEVMNYSELNMKNLSLDMSDTDGDGLANYYEDLLGTDKNKADTDDDGLSDYDEFLKVGTSPTMQDTDENGVTDDKEDFDSDGLSSSLEVAKSTNAFLADTDGDGLSDGEEVLQYYTNPIVQDSDEDGLSDGEDVALSFVPTNPDTDGDGILDGDEILYQTHTQEIDTTRKAGVGKVSVSLECNGHIDNRVNIIDTYDLDMRSSDVVGLVGVPVDISTNVEFTTADITFTYDEAALGDTIEDNLCMMWYDEENDMYVLLEDCIVDKETNTITYTTTHFSTYLIVDKKVWLDAMRMDMNYRNSQGIVYYDIAFVVDVSGSMSGSRIKRAKTALSTFIDAMMVNDRAAIVKFNSSATLEQDLTNNTTLLISKVSGLKASGGTKADTGLTKGIDVLKNADGTNARMLILICDGSISYNASIVEEAKENRIVIHCINVVNGTSKVMERIASETGGNYYYAATTEEIEKIVSELEGVTIDNVDVTDTDGDGLYDVYEVNGMRLSNGQVVYTDPNNIDTDGDGISDYDAMGGQPVKETLTVDGIEFSCTLNHSIVYGKLSSEFIYVDGTLNADGTRNYEKRDYLPYTTGYIEDKYDAKRTISLFGATKTAIGAAGAHGLFSDMLPEVSEEQKKKYKDYNTLVAVGIQVATPDYTARECFDVYITGKGGDYEAWRDGYTRKYIDAEQWILTNRSCFNSARDYYSDNMVQAMLVAERVLNEYNQEVYIATSPSAEWQGCDYVDYSNYKNLVKNFFTVLTNIEAFGTFNNAKAGGNFYCTYNPETEEYTIDYNYYLIDYYDYENLDELHEQDLLGMARSYELYGYCNGRYTWKKGVRPVYVIFGELVKW